jgi:L-ascorbate 6-phosphate lactonase
MKRPFPLLLPCLVLFILAPPAFSGNRILDQIRSHHQGIAIWWTGNAGWLIKSEDLLIGTDLTLDNDEKVQPPPVTAPEIAANLDVLLVTHHHSDHCNSRTIRDLLRTGKCIFVLPGPCLKELIRINIPRDRLIVPEPLHPFVVKGLHVEPIHAIHGNQEFTVLTREPDFIEKIAHNCDYVFETRGKRFREPATRS